MLFTDILFSRLYLIFPLKIRALVNTRVKLVKYLSLLIVTTKSILPTKPSGVVLRMMWLTKELNPLLTALWRLQRMICWLASGSRKIVLCRCSNFYFCWISIVLKYLCIYIELLSEVHTPAGAEGQVHPADLAGPLLDRL